MTIPQLQNAMHKGDPPRPGRTSAGSLAAARRNHARARVAAGLDGGECGL